VTSHLKTLLDYDSTFLEFSHASDMELRCVSYMTWRRVLTFALDAGGPGVISELMIVEEIMNRIRWDRKLDSTPRPCDYAEFMIGSGLGGEMQ
jgi:hypothetical protein